MGKKIVFICHCLLNCHARVETPHINKAGARELLQLLLENDVGIVQLPCPELSVYGLKRWGHVKEQFDTPYYRRHCRSIFKPYLEQIQNYLECGHQVLAVVGVEGSPSCGVTQTCSGNWGGELSGAMDINGVLESLAVINGEGVFTEEIKKALTAHCIAIPVVGMDEENPHAVTERLRSLLKT